MRKRRRFGLLATLSVSTALILLCLPGGASFAEGSICATVKIEIKQEATLERQAFDAHMRINNALSHIGLESIRVDVLFKDAEGNPVPASSDPNNTTALFFIKIDSMDKINAVDGTGTVAASTSADIHWLIIPSTGASKGLESGTPYYVGATLTYTIGGETHVTEVSPDYIFVKPMPEFTLDYFLPSDVYGDDAFTPAIEPVVPFTLGVRVANRGTGTGRNMKIDSAQPKIIENERGLLIGFNIEGTEVNGRPATKSLLAEFGDIGPNTSGIARWIMTCTLSGRFTAFDATFSHDDALGGELTSLMKAVNTHFLVRDVMVDLPGRDNVRDFLAKDGGVYRVYESENSDTDVTDQSASATLQDTGQSGTELNQSLSTPVTAGFMYVKLPDPYTGGKILKRVVRSDGKNIRLENAWLSKTRGANHTWIYELNLLDSNSTGSYTLVFDNAGATPQAPVLQFIPDRTGVEGRPLSFIVEASGPDGTTPVLSASPLPARAAFSDEGNGTGVFDWTPAVGQAGRYVITFKAANGDLFAARSATLTIYPANDTDGDGMPDDWEMRHFGDLSRDGRGDFDGDGISDLDEYLNGGDPTRIDHAPTTPVIVSPADGSEITVLTPELTIMNSTDPDGGVLTYDFEIFSDPGLKNKVISRLGVLQGSGTTSFTVSQLLSDNTRYYWRVRATDGGAYSLWAYGSFFVNTANDVPSGLQVGLPANNDEVDTRTPLLQVNNAVDPDGDVLLYAFAVYADSGLNALVASASGIAAGTDGITSWTVPADKVLNDNTTYYWQAGVTDAHGAVASTSPASFLVNTANHLPGPPTIASPALGSEVTAQTVNLTVTNAADADGDPLSYTFELDKVNTFNSPARQVSGVLASGNGVTAWAVSALEDNTQYYWRARAGAGKGHSGWVQGSFSVNTANDPPSAPTLRNPGLKAWVVTLTPYLAVNAAEDPDKNGLTYRYEVYSDGGLTSLVAQNETTALNWTLPSNLTNNTTYYWRVQARDEHGLAGAWMEAAPFFVRHLPSKTVADVTVIAADVPAAGARVFLFSANGSYLSKYGDTDSTGRVSIELPAGTAFKFRADIMGNQYWSGVLSVSGSGNYPVSIDAGGGVFHLTVQREGSVALAGLKAYLFNAGGSYLGKSGTTDAAGNVSFNVPAGSYKIRVDYLGYSFWSEVKAVSGAANAVLMIEHRDANITINTVFNGTPAPLEGVKVYLFNGAGSYLGRSHTTGADGKVTFPVPAKDYKVRADYLGRQYWSAVFNWTDGTVAVPLADVEVTVGRSGQINANVPVYVFSATNSYLGITAGTDQTSKVTFRLPAGSYKFRADFQGSQYWSAETALAADRMTPVTVDTGGGAFVFTVLKGANTPLTGVPCCVFNAAGTYLGMTGTTDGNGQVSFDLSSGNYKMRVAYLGAQFWSDVAVVTGSSSLTLLIPQDPVDVVISTAGDPVSGARVYLFSSTGSYLGQYADTDSNGRVYFNLPRGVSFKFRADVMGNQYWSDVTQVTGGGTIHVPINTGGGVLRVTVRKSASAPMSGLTAHLFSATGIFLGQSRTTDGAGEVSFGVPSGSYKVRVDYLGSSYWSEEKTVTGATSTTVTIEHRVVNITVNSSFSGSATPLEGVTIYLFSGAGSYLGQSQTTGSGGVGTFDVPGQEYKVRADYLGQSYWSAAFNWTDGTVTVPLGDAAVTVGRSGAGIGNVPVYAFSTSNAYLGITANTDQGGLKTFRLPAGSYKFRADYQGSQYWSSETVVVADQSVAASVNTGGGSFTLTVRKGESVPLAGVSCYVFQDTGSYIGLSGTTDSAGQVSFDLSDGNYKIRVDYLGAQFWTEVIGVPEAMSYTRTIPHQNVTVTVNGALGSDVQAKNHVPVYVFSPSGSYLSLSAYTNAEGQATFSLPEIPVKVRADYLGQSYWSGEVAWQNPMMTIPEGTAYVHASMTGQDITGAPVYVYSAAGSYLNINGTTNGNGIVEFRLPADSYRFRGDYQGSRYWTTAGVVADVVNGIEINAGGGRFVLTVTDGANALSGQRVYVFNPGGSYLGMYGVSDGSGQVCLDLAAGSYKFRLDYLGYQHWTEVYTVPGTLSGSFGLENRNVAVTVSGLYQQARVLSGLPVYLFTPSGAYLGQNRTTDENGRVSFNLPNEEYKVRIDYLGRQYWSDIFQWRDTDMTIEEGHVSVKAVRGGNGVSGLQVYLFNTTGGYLGRHETTDTTGKAGFTIPSGSYQFRVDQGSTQRWSAAVAVTSGEAGNVDVNLD